MLGFRIALLLVVQSGAGNGDVLQTILRAKVLWIVAGIFLLLYVVGPIAVWMTQKQAAHPQLTNYTASLNQPSFGVLAAFCSAMQSAGFDFIGIFGLVGQTNNVNAYLAYLVHRRNGDGAIAAVVHATSGNVPAKLVYEFATRFSDQSSITTSNGATPQVFKRPKQKPVYKFPTVQDPLRLYRLHQQLIARDKPGIAKDAPSPGNETARLVDGLQRECRDQVQAGILRLDNDNDCYRPTLIGAFRMTWKLLPPFKQLAEESTNSQAAKLLKALETPGIMYAGQGV